MKSAMVLLCLLAGSAFAHAENFLCQGTGRFAAIENQTVNLVWKKSYQKVLIETQSLKVQVYVDKSNSDGRHYFGIEVMDLGPTGVLSFRGAKGSLKDMVQYSDSVNSTLTCIPN